MFLKVSILFLIMNYFNNIETCIRMFKIKNFKKIYTQSYIFIKLKTFIKKITFIKKKKKEKYI
jgi:hypothetical protein